MTILHSLIQNLDSTDNSVQNEALMTAGLLLEKHSNAPSTQEVYKQFLAEKYLIHQLSDADQVLLIHAIGNLLLSNSATTAMLWAIGRAYSRLEPLPYLLQWLIAHSISSDESCIRQALLSIDLFLWFGDEGILLPEVKLIIDNAKPQAKLLELTNHDLEEICRLASEILSTIAF